MAELNFDASTVAPSTGTYDALPAGWYNAVIDNTEMKPTKAGTGAYLEIRFNVVDGEFTGRKVFARLNIRNPNPVAQEIGYKDLSAICHAVGIINVQQSQQLHNIPLKIKVSVTPADGQYEASNDIKAYRNINENVGGGAPAAPATTAPVIPQAAPAVAPQQAWQPPQQGAPQAAPAAQQAPAAAPVEQPWQQAPQQQPAPAVQQAPAAAPAAAPEQAWQQPAAQQPWQQAPQQAPAAAPQQQPAPQAAPAQAAPAGDPQAAVPPWQQ